MQNIKYTRDLQGLLKNVAWALMKDSDTTVKRNKYDLRLGLVAVVDGSGRTRVNKSSLLCGENSEFQLVIRMSPVISFARTASEVANYLH